MYLKGKDGLQDFSKAVEYNSQVNGYNYGDALRDCGIFYKYGNDVDQIYEKVIECYNEATHYRNRGAFFSLELIYYYGRGVDRNYSEALKCFNQIADGLPGAFNLYVYVESSYCKNEDHLMHDYLMQDETPVTGEAHYYLGIMFNNGLGTEVNQKMAENHFQIAADCYHLGYKIALS